MLAKNYNSGKVFVGLSGGVDSAVSAALLSQQGYDVTGVFIRISLPGYPCSAGEDKIDAQRVAAHLQIPFIEIDLSREYEAEVFRTSMHEFEKGHTPNPDTLCNQKIKFGAFYDFAMAQGADYIATGHYARLKTVEGRTHLLAGVDPEKDQSYFLWMVPERHLARTLFPVGGFHKTRVRLLAKEFDLPNAVRRDSQGLCFLGDTSIGDMLSRELTPVPGDVLNEEGEVIGSHLGAMRYTLGQRHGFMLESAGGVPHFVVAKDIGRNTITVSTSHIPQRATKTILKLADTNWIGSVASGHYQARFRYRQSLVGAEFQRTHEGALVTLHAPHFAPIGQSLVLYTGERCVGGGIIVDTQLT